MAFCGSKRGDGGRECTSCEHIYKTHWSCVCMSSMAVRMTHTAADPGSGVVLLRAWGPFRVPLHSTTPTSPGLDIFGCVAPWPGQPWTPSCGTQACRQSRGTAISATFPTRTDEHDSSSPTSHWRTLAPTSPHISPTRFETAVPRNDSTPRRMSINSGNISTVCTSLPARP